MELITETAFHSSSSKMTEEAKDECEKIRDFLKKELTKGDTWYLVDCRWFKQWKKYVGFDQWDVGSIGDPDAYPGPVNNSSLLKGDGDLKEHLIDELDYVLFPKEGWEFLLQKHGSANGVKDIIDRKVMEQGMFVKHCKVEIYLMDIKIRNIKCPDQPDITWKFSQTDSIESIELAGRDEFGISDDTEVRVWNKYMTNSYEQLGKREQTLQEAGLYQGQIVVIETRNKDGSWPKGGSENGFKVTKARRLKYNEEKERKRRESLEKAVEHNMADTSVRAQELVSCDHNGCEKAAHLYCNLCLENLCANCAGLHLLKKSKYGHDVVEYKSRKQRRPLLYCEKHTEFISELFCEQCKITVCSKCLSSNSHKGHEFTEMLAVLTAKKECIGREKDEISTVIQKLENFKTGLSAKLEERQQKYRQLDDEVASRREEMMKAVENAVTKRRQRIAELKASDVNQLQTETSKIDQQIATARETLESCCQLLRDQNPRELLHFHSKAADLQTFAGTIPHMKNYLFKEGSLSADDFDKGFGEIELHQTP